MTSEQIDNETAAARAPRFGLSGKLLLLTIVFVMIAEVLIYVPSIANYRPGSPTAPRRRAPWRSC